jgi:hypothetical protein
MTLNLLPKENLFLIFYYIILQSFVNFGAQRGGFHNLQYWFSLEKWKTNCYRVGLRAVWPKYRFGLTTLFKCWPRATGQWPEVGEPNACASPPGRWAVGQPSLTCGTWTVSSLSPSPIKRVTLAEAFPFVAFLPNAEVRTPFLSSPASHRLTLPLGDSSHVPNHHFLELRLP